ncbi:MAG: formate--tetrahydrofolate ligase [Clostridiales bacterium]|nr:formate--tetrahydrofolate ligase [Clostridiales bacterium]
MKTDIEIANEVKLLHIEKIAKKLGIKKLELYGNYKAKVKLEYGKKSGKLILVTAMNPTQSGNGKTTVAIGLAEAIEALGKKVCLSLREPSLGPVFGMKGGATGGGYSQIAPMEDINLHFTGDMHAITTANNLLCSIIDNHIFQGNELDIDKVVFNRCLDINDRALREISCCKGKNNGEERKDGFIITAASEVMSILCLSESLEELKERLGNILVAFDKKGNPIFAKDLKANEAMAIVLKDALKPNLVQTLGHTPAFVHGGPFANIAHGCSSIIATKMAMSYSDFVVTEAGFGADLGAEKFFDVKCRKAKLNPSAVVLIATIKALKLHGGADKNLLDVENLPAVEEGMKNLFKHLENLKNIFGVPVCVTLNTYSSDTKREKTLLIEKLKELGVACIENQVWQKGGKGAAELAKEVVRLSNNENELKFAYDLSDKTKAKIEKVCKKIYGAKLIVFEEKAKEKLAQIKKLKLDNLPIVIAKTQYSLSDNPKLLNRPKDFSICIKDIEFRLGAGFLVVVAGNILLMPGLSKNPNALNMSIDKDFCIKGLF